MQILPDGACHGAVSTIMVAVFPKGPSMPRKPGSHRHADERRREPGLGRMGSAARLSPGRGHRGHRDRRNHRGIAIADARGDRGTHPPGGHPLRRQDSTDVGAGTNSTASTMARTRALSRLGVDGVMLVTPYYNKPPQEGLFRHFTGSRGRLRGAGGGCTTCRSRTAVDLQPATGRRGLPGTRASRRSRMRARALRVCVSC